MPNVPSRSMAVRVPPKSTKGFSLRESLMEQGVTMEADLRHHMSFVYGQSKMYDKINIRRYRSSPP